MPDQLLSYYYIISSLSWTLLFPCDALTVQQGCFVSVVDIYCDTIL